MSQTLEELIEKPNFIECIQKAGEFENFAKLSTLIMGQKENSRLNGRSSHFRDEFKKSNTHPEKTIHYENVNNAMKEYRKYEALLSQARNRVSMAKIAYNTCRNKPYDYNTYNSNNCDRELEFYNNWVSEENRTVDKLNHWYHKVKKYEIIYNEYVDDYKRGLKKAKQKDKDLAQNPTVNYTPDIKNLINTLNKAYEKCKSEKE